MKRILLISMLALLTISSYGRRHVAENAVVVADTIYYAADKSSVANSEQASYYRLLMKQDKGLSKRDVFQDFYMNGTLKAEGEYSFIDLGNDANTVLNGEVTTYYQNGKEKWHGKYVNGMREGYLRCRCARVAWPLCSSKKVIRCTIISRLRLRMAR